MRPRGQTCARRGFVPPDMAIYALFRPIDPNGLPFEGPTVERGGQKAEKEKACAVDRWRGVYEWGRRACASFCWTQFWPQPKPRLLPTDFEPEKARMGQPRALDAGRRGWGRVWWGRSVESRPRGHTCASNRIKSIFRGPKREHSCTVRCTWVGTTRHAHDEPRNQTTVGRPPFPAHHAGLRRRRAREAGEASRRRRVLQSAHASTYATEFGHDSIGRDECKHNASTCPRLFFFQVMTEIRSARYAVGTNTNLGLLRANMMAMKRCPGQK